MVSTMYNNKKKTKSMMSNLEVDLYLSQFKGFFKQNPNELMNLIGDILEDDFFRLVEEQCYKNIENGEDIQVTRQQLIDIVVKLKSPESDFEKDIKQSMDKVFEHTKFGDICLN